MKAEYIEYLIRLSFIWTALLLFYQWSLAKSDQWKGKRAYLAGAYLLGWLIPLLPALIVSSSVPQLGVSPFGQATVFIFTDNQSEGGNAVFSWSWVPFFLILYLAGVTWQSGRLLFHFFQLLYWKKSGRRSFFRSFLVIRHNQVASPFAGMNAIFLPIDQDPDTEEMICLHESIHLMKRHNIERIPLLLGSILLWFHPLQWIFSHWQRELQEFEADEGVIREFPLRDYGQLLIQASMTSKIYQGLGLFSSPLKKRIHMMTKRKISKSLKKSHYLLLTLLLGFLVVNCSDLVEQVDLNEKTEFLTTEVDQTPTLKAISSSDEAASPHRILLEHVYREIRYPVVARNGGMEGTFQAAFTIDENGKMQSLTAKAIPKEEVDKDLRIVVVGYGNTNEKNTAVQERASMISALEREIERTLSTLPDWNPAFHGGKPVPVRMNLFFEYKLE